MQGSELEESRRDVLVRSGRLRARTKALPGFLRRTRATESKGRSLAALREFADEVAPTESVVTLRRPSQAHSLPKLRIAWVIVERLCTRTPKQPKLIRAVFLHGAKGVMHGLVLVAGSKRRKRQKRRADPLHCGSRQEFLMRGMRPAVITTCGVQARHFHQSVGRSAGHAQGKLRGGECALDVT